MTRLILGEGNDLLMRIWLLAIAYPELISQIQHEGSIRADTNDERYRKSMARRQLESQTSKR